MEGSRQFESEKVSNRGLYDKLLVLARMSQDVVCINAEH